MKKTLIYNARIIDKENDFTGGIIINGKKIESVLSAKEAASFAKQDSFVTINANGMALMPSFVDLHAHFRDPGFTAKEDIESGSKAAVAGGYGIVVLMPNTNPPVSTLKEVRANNSKAKELGLLNVIQSSSITTHFDGENIIHLDELNAKEVPLITEDGREVKDSAVMFEGMKKAACKKMIVSCHAEDPFLAEEARPLRKQALSLLAEAEKISSSKKQSDIKKCAALKKAAAEILSEANRLLALAEDASTFRNIRLAEEAGCHVHLCHVSTKKSIEAIRKAKAEGMNITAEITPHHIGICGTKMPQIFEIVNPPLRSQDDIDSLIEALDDGTADCIATDHAPHTEQDKLGGSPGFSGIETSFAVCYTTLVLGNAFTVSRLSELMSYNPSKILGLKNTGLIKKGFAANVVLVDLERIWTVRGKDFVSKGKYTPLEGQKVVGKVVKTFYEGKTVFELEK